MGQIYLTLCVTIVFSQGAFAQTKTIDNPVNQGSQYIISGVHTLSVHVRDTVSHDSVYRFFLQKSSCSSTITRVFKGQSWPGKFPWRRLPIELG